MTFSATTLTAEALHNVTDNWIFSLWVARRDGEVRFYYNGREFMDMTTNPSGPGKVIHYGGGEKEVIPDDALLEVVPVGTD